MKSGFPTIVSAEEADAPQIARLIRQAWSYEQPDIDRIARVVERPDHWVALARLNEDDVATTVGFISCFLVPLSGDRSGDRNGDRNRNGDGNGDGHRWQIDLLAVQPGHRGQGIGRRLIQAALVVGQAHHAQRAQALIDADNTASVQAFTAAGFVQAGGPLRLLVRRSNHSNSMAWPDFCRGYRPIVVETLTYSGIWLEDGRGDPPTNRLDVISLLCPEQPDDSTIFDSAQTAGFDDIGRFHNWVTE